MWPDEQATGVEADSASASGTVRVKVFGWGALRMTRAETAEDGSASPITGSQS